MIILNTDKGIVRIESWDDITSRPGYVAKIDPRAVKLKTMLGSYHLKDEVNCGLMSCNQPHLRGYLVETDTGAVTNIGKDCGKAHFGVDFVQMRQRFDRDVQRKTDVETVQQFQARLPTLREELNRLKEGERGANWAYNSARALRDPLKGLGGVVRRVSDLIRRGTGEIVATRPATKPEQDRLEAQAGRRLQPQYIDETVGRVAGLGFFSPDLDLRELIVKDIEVMFDLIEHMDVQQAKPRDLRSAAKWAGAYESRIASINRALELAGTLLTQENLEPLARFGDSPESQRQMRAYLRSLPRVTA